MESFLCVTKPEDLHKLRNGPEQISDVHEVDGGFVNVGKNVTPDKRVWHGPRNEMGAGVSYAYEHIN